MKPLPAVTEQCRKPNYGVTRSRSQPPCIIILQANLEIDREPAAADPEDPQAEMLKAEGGGGKSTAATGCMFQVINFLAVLAFTFVLVF